MSTIQGTPRTASSHQRVGERLGTDRASRRNQPCWHLSFRHPELWKKNILFSLNLPVCGTLLQHRYQTKTIYTWLLTAVLALAFVLTWVLLCMGVWVSSLLLIRAPVTRLGPTLTQCNLKLTNYICLQRACFQKWSHSQALGVRTSTCVSEGTQLIHNIQPKLGAIPPLQGDQTLKSLKLTVQLWGLAEKTHVKKFRPTAHEDKLLKNR